MLARLHRIALTSAIGLVACGHATHVPQGDQRPAIASRPAPWCVDGWCRENPVLGINHSVRGTSANDVWSLETFGVVHHFDGVQWTLSDMHLRPPQAAQAFWPLGPTSAVVMGLADSGHRWDGSTWQRFGGPAFAVWASSANDIWAATNGHPYCQFVHWDGARWTKDPFNGAVGGTIISIWGTASDDVWAINNGGTVLHFDGARWTIAVDDLYVGRRPVVSGQIRPGNWQLTSIWGTSRSDVWVVGGFDLRPIVIHWDGTSWSEVPFPAQSRLSAVWAGARDDAWAASRDANALYHWDGKVWQLHSMHPASNIGSLWGSGPRDVWASGVALLHWDGVSWTDLNLTVPALHAVWFANATSGWAVGRDGVILHWDGQAWSRSTSGTTHHLSGVWGTSPRDVWAVGSDATVVRYDGVRWTAIAVPDGDFTGVAGTAPDDVWLTLSRGAALHWDGHHLEPHDAPSELAASPSGGLWGLGTSLQRWDGKAWQPQGAPQPQGALQPEGEASSEDFGPAVSAIWPTGNIVWGAGAGVMKWQADQWSSPELPPPANGFFGPEYYQMVSIWARSADDVWACGGTQVLHWDGRSWQRFHLPGPSLHAITGAGNDVWVVGDGGTIYHFHAGAPEPRPTNQAVTASPARAAPAPAPASTAANPLTWETAEAEEYRRATEARKGIGVLLAPLGRRILAALPPPPPYTPDPLAVGPCERPTEAERTTLRRAIAASTKEGRPASLMLGFGCKDRDGIVVDVSYDRATRGTHREGVWRVVHVDGTAASARVMTLVELTRLLASDPDDGFGMDHTDVKTLALIDLDGDGSHDPILVRNLDTFSRHDGVELAVWFSMRRTLTPSIRLSQVFSIDVPPAQANLPLVLRIRTYAGDLPIAYRCVEADGTLDRCPAIEEVRRRDRVEKIAQDFANSATGVFDDKIDRELLAELLDTLAVAPTERSALLAALEPGRPEIHVMRELARVRASRADDALIYLPDPRPTALRALLGDTPCTPATAAEVAAARAKITTWIKDHAAQDLLDHGMCTMGKRCRAQHPTPVTIEASCVAVARGYYAASWSYSDNPSVVHDGLFYVAGGALTLVTSAAGPIRSSPPLEVKLSRHGDHLVALALGREELLPVVPYRNRDELTRSRAYAIDGVLTTLPRRARTDWYRFGETEYRMGNPAPAADGLIAEWSDDRREVALWHWDGAWTQLVAFPLTLRGPVPATNPAGRWLWDQARLTTATAFLSNFQYQFMTWRDSADVRADTAEALAVVGADPAIIARVAAEAARVH
jgi:hypothetical protein